jgi:hypothetical protein
MRQPGHALEHTSEAAGAFTLLRARVALGPLRTTALDLVPVGVPLPVCTIQSSKEARQRLRVNHSATEQQRKHGTVTAQHASAGEDCHSEASLQNDLRRW